MILQNFLQKILCFIICLKIISCHKHSLNNYNYYKYTNDGNLFIETTSEISSLPTLK